MEHGMLIKQLCMIIDEEQKTKSVSQFFIYFCYTYRLTISGQESDHSCVMLIHRKGTNRTHSLPHLPQSYCVSLV